MIELFIGTAALSLFGILGLIVLWFCLTFSSLFIWHYVKKLSRQMDVLIATMKREEKGVIATEHAGPRDLIVVVCPHCNQETKYLQTAGAQPCEHCDTMIELPPEEQIAAKDWSSYG